MPSLSNRRLTYIWLFFFDYHYPFSHSRSPPMPLPASQKLQAAMANAIAKEAAKPLPTEDQLQRVSDLCSQLHYGFLHRPSADHPDRQEWYTHFYKVLGKLGRLLHRARFFELPAFIIGAMAEYNNATFHKRPRPMKVDAIVPGEQKNMIYKAKEDGPVQYLPIAKVSDTWWPVQTGALQPHSLSQTTDLTCSPR